MIVTPTGYRSVDSVLSSRERADRVLALCFEGDVSAGRALVGSGEDADSLLARGVLTYWLAQTGGSFTYESAKNDLSRSSRLFVELAENDRAALSDIWLALCYWRLGQMDEAFLILTPSCACDNLRVRFLALVNRSVIQTEAKDWKKALLSLEAAQRVFEEEPSLSWRGKFFQQRGLCYKLAYEESGSRTDADKALVDYEAASEHYERAGNLRFEAAIVNNLANLYRTIGDIKRARQNIDRAITLFERIGDRSHLAHAKDTKALILLDSGDAVRAKKYADHAVLLLRNHDPAWLTIPLVTRAKITCRMGLDVASRRDFEEAINIAEGSGDLVKAREIYLEEAETLAHVLSLQALSEIFAKVNEIASTRESRIAQTVLVRASSPDLNSFSDLRTSERQREHEIILRALEKARGSVTKAAKALGKTHGGLRHIIKTRHPELQAKCRPVVPRKSVIKSPVR